MPALVGTGAEGIGFGVDSSNHQLFGGARGADESADHLGILDAGRALDAGGHIDAAGAGDANGFRDIVGM